MKVGLLDGMMRTGVSLEDDSYYDKKACKKRDEAAISLGHIAALADADFT